MSESALVSPELLELLVCPGCGAALAQEGKSLRCQGCAQVFAVSDGIPELYWANDWESGADDVTDQVRSFYEESPFPDYEDLDSIERLFSKANEGLFARLLDEQIPSGARVIECGCGTGQLSNFLSVHNREVVAADLCMNSLRMGAAFARREKLDRVRFTQMNLFRPPFAPESFHLVISNGVLHHTSDPRLGFESIGRLVAPGGYILVGLYHQHGRLITDMRRRMFNLTGDRFKWLDPNLRDLGSNQARKASWFADQYKHPHESKHTIRETIPWLDSAGFDFVTSVPSPRLFGGFSPDAKLFEDAERGSDVELALAEWAMAFQGHREGGFFVVIGRKRAYN